MNQSQKMVVLVAILWTAWLAAGEPEVQAVFPAHRPEDANFNRPTEGQRVDVSPPGFCWWRAGPRDEVYYRLIIRDASQVEVHASPRLRDPVYVPDQVLPPGAYSWTVQAVDRDGQVLASRPASRFLVEPNASDLPWVSPEELLARVPSGHPRLLFPRSELEAIRKTLHTTRKDAFDDLISLADAALEMEPMPRPTFDRFDRSTEYAARRTAYRAAYQQFSRTYHRGVVPLSLAYLLTGDERYGLAAKSHVLPILKWDVEGIASLEEGFDEIGLRIARILPHCYDWLYEILTEEEREEMHQALRIHGQAMLGRLQRRDFLNYSAYSHDGRLPGYLVEFSIVLAEEEVAQSWLDYGLRALMTVFPHWAGQDGGWAEGVNYAVSYNDRFLTPLASLEKATGFDLWQMAYFRNMRRFLTTCTSPRGEIMPFGDGEHNSVHGKADQLRSILQVHASRFKDPGVKWWTTTLDSSDLGSSRMGAVHRLILPDDVEPVRPTSWAQDHAFEGIGWASLHSDLTRPEEDLMVMFKSSPYAAISHSHADQNSFVVMKGGRALAIPAGERYPQHFSPFHTEYTWQTMAHNALLINGRGQISRDENAGGRLVGFRSTDPMGYVCGDATQCYRTGVECYRRHVVLIRPSVVLVVDDLIGTDETRVDWLLHGIERFDLHAREQFFVSKRGNERLTVHLLAPGGFDFSQTDAWPVPPKKDYLMVTAPEPDPQWHLTATLREARPHVRIAAIMINHTDNQQPEYQLTRKGSGKITLRIPQDAGIANIHLELEPPPGEPLSPIGVVSYSPKKGRDTTLRLEPNLDVPGP